MCKLQLRFKLYLCKLQIENSFYASQTGRSYVNGFWLSGPRGNIIFTLAAYDVWLSACILSFNLPLCKLKKIECYEKNGLYNTAYS